MLLPIQIEINDEVYNVQVDVERSLLSVLRDELGTTGPKYGCGEGKCGACTVLMDGKPVQACSVTVGAAAGSSIMTAEGLAQHGQLHPLQQAFLDQEALQCGYCTPGMIMSALALLNNNPQPTTDEITHAMQDNICRCGVYQRIIAAIQNAAEQMRSGEVATDVVAHDEASANLEVAPDAGQDEGIFVAYPCPDLLAVRYAGATEIPAPQDRPLAEIGPWLHIDSTGQITVAIGKAEVGQNTRTAMGQIVAEELRVPLAAVRVVMGDTGRAPFDMGTFGSRSTPITGPQVWKVGATARQTLLELAAAIWQVDQAELQLHNGTVSHPASGRTASFGDLAQDRNILRIASDDAPVTPPNDWTTAGHTAAKIGGQAFVTAQHRYASDQVLPGMLYGKILRPPAYGATLTAIDTNAAAAMEGVTVVQDGDFVGVTASDEFSATQAIEAIRAGWKTAMQVSQPELFDYLKANPLAPVEGDRRRMPYVAIEGSVETGLAAAHLTLSQSYTVDYIAHAPLEPRAALAEWQGDRLLVWTGSSRPFGVRSELAQAFAIPESQIRVIVPDTGSGYGGKHTGQAAIEAARLAKAVGKPVKVVWTRQEEFMWAYLRPAGLIEITGGVDSEGHFTALELHNYNSGSAGIEALYGIPNRHIHYQPCDSPLPQGSYRSLAAPANHFARESFVDELAHQLGIDPLAMRLRNLNDERMIAVLTAAAKAFGWGKSTPEADHGFGIAGGFDKNSYVATCAEVYVNPTTHEIQLLRVVAAYDCGALINPANVRNQVEGAIVQGIGGALFESIQFANGRILNPDFADYRVARFGDMPTIETILIDRKDVPSAGAGETPIVAIAPAIANAVFAATGVRVRSMPMRMAMRTPHAPQPPRAMPVG